MREIKFRALKEEPNEYVGSWDRDNNQDKAKWVYGSGIIPVYINTCPTDRLEMAVDVNYDELDYWQPGYSSCKIIPGTICQYAGLTDKDGNEIYEGDIVKIDGQKENFVVVFVVDNARFGLQSKTQLLYFEPFFSGSIEIIGNEYENSELL